MRTGHCQRNVVCKLGLNQWGGMPGNVLLVYSIEGK
jgi:hypothetical protein